jgi:hypothetical protein
MKKMLSVSLCMAVWCWSAKPMESIENYNMILVHGAADMRSGLDCRNGADGKNFKNAYDTILNNKKDLTTRIGGYEDWVLPWDENFHGGFLFQDTKVITLDSPHEGTAVHNALFK